MSALRQSIILFLFLFLLAPNYLLANSSCKELLSNTPLPSINTSTESTRLHDVWRSSKNQFPTDRWVPFEIWNQWTGKDFLKYAGQLLGFLLPSTHHNAHVFPMEILAFRNLSPIERMTVNEIYSKIQFTGQNVEHGSIIITLKNGKVVPLELVDGVRTHLVGTDITNAINEFLKKNNYTESDIANLQVFHNHPSNRPLSPEDISMARQWNQFYNLENPSPFPIHIYSISYQQGEFVLFHYGVQSRRSTRH